MLQAIVLGIVLAVALVAAASLASPDQDGASVETLSQPQHSALYPNETENRGRLTY
ncbi:MAG: hypothetical protein JJ866_20055 [Roseibium sp.]|uniref:hypothetical protein n=1 Tax=Roseibium sp. TaxID=1936156 RepID=UPI001B162CC3|nr:hypothetical protein [Roseibium sp.]MBO6894247.1 hypothetical protein [Roseibium sp.]